MKYRVFIICVCPNIKNHKESLTWHLDKEDILSLAIILHFKDEDPLMFIDLHLLDFSFDVRLSLEK